MVQKLNWYGVYLRSTLLYYLLQEVLKLVLPTATGPEVYVATMTTIFSNSYDYFVETLNHMRSLKLKDNPGENFTDCCDENLVNEERLESAGAFNTKHLGYIIRIFEYNYVSRLCLWVTKKCKEGMDFIKELCVSDEDVMQPDDIITYGYLVKEDIREYRNIFDSKL